MKVLHVVPYFPPDRIGGVGEVAAHLHHSLLAAGHDSRVVSSGETDDDPRVHRFGRSPRRLALAVLRSLRHAQGVDVVHAHHGEALLLLAALRVRRLRPRILVTMHVDNRRIGRSFRPYTVNGRPIRPGWEAHLQRYILAPVKHLMDRTAMALADEVNFISRRTAVEVLGSRAGAEAPVIYNGVAEPPATDALVDTVELLYVGTAGHRKRTETLPDILTMVRASIPEARLRIVGFDLDAAPRIRAELVASGLEDQVLWEGPVGSAEIPRFYQAAGVLIVPSAYEGLPMVIAEALRSGLPCVATNVGGTAEIIEDGVNGYLVGLDDVADLARKAVAILAEPGLRADMSIAGRTRAAEMFSLERQVQEYLRLYDSMRS